MTELQRERSVLKKAALTGCLTALVGASVGGLGYGDYKSYHPEHMIPSRQGLVKSGHDEDILSELGLLEKRSSVKKYFSYINGPLSETIRDEQKKADLNEILESPDVQRYVHICDGVNERFDKNLKKYGAIGTGIGFSGGFMTSLPIFYLKRRRDEKK